LNSEALSMHSGLKCLYSVAVYGTNEQSVTRIYVVLCLRCSVKWFTTLLYLGNSLYAANV